MECSTRETSPHSQSEGNGSNGDKGLEEEMIISFGSFGLCKNRNLMSRPTVTQSKNNTSSGQEGANGDTEKSAASQVSMEDEYCSSQGIQIDEYPASLDIERPCAQEDPARDTEKLAAAQVSMGQECLSRGIEIDELPDSLDVEWPSTGLFLQGSTWERPNIYITGGMTPAENNHSGQESSPVSSNTAYADNDLNHVEADLYGSLRGQTYASSICEDSPIQSPAGSAWNNQSDAYNSGNHMMNGSGHFSPVIGSQFNYDELSQIRNLGYYLNNNIASSTRFLYHDVAQQNSCLQPGSDVLGMARTRDGSMLLQKYLEPRDCMITQIILSELLDSIFHLMIDGYGYHVLAVLFEKCHINLLWPIISKAYNEPETFICIAFIDKGSRLIQRLIKRLRKTSMVKIITGILSTRSYELLTHKTGSHVIRQCFVTLGEEPNLVFYEAISNHILDLATDPVGCISLNTCIDSITGPRRTRLLEYLAAHSRYLSIDPSGNFVVQHMLNLDNERLTEEILHHLQGSFELLGQKQGGSHVVEKCLRTSQRGLDLVVKEILKDEKALFRLAQDTFGNYVIQTALKETKINDKSLYQALLKALRPYYSQLVGRTTGRHVAALMRVEELTS